MKAFKIKFNEKINCNVAITEFSGTGKFWFFNNGQYGEKTEYLEAMEYRLAYHYGRVYINSCIRHDNEYGSTSFSSQTPLTKDVFNESVLEIVKKLFAADKIKGIIDNNYSFN